MMQKLTGINGVNGDYFSPLVLPRSAKHALVCFRPQNRTIRCVTTCRPDLNLDLSYAPPNIQLTAYLTKTSFVRALMVHMDPNCNVVKHWGVAHLIAL